MSTAGTRDSGVAAFAPLYQLSDSSDPRSTPPGRSVQVPTPDASIGANWIWLTIAVVAMWVLPPPVHAAPIIIPPVSAGPVLQPPVVESVNGLMKADVTIVRAGLPGSGKPVLSGGLPLYSHPNSGNLILPLPPQLPLNFAAGYQFTTANGQDFPAQYPGPTLKIRPGDVIDLTLQNNLGVGPDGIPPQPISYVTNFHTHGFLVSPLGNGDNVYRSMLPDGRYRTFIEVPEAQQPGIDWYHTHQHGSTADQVYAGLAGFIQVGNVLDPWPEFAGKYNERLLGLTLVNVVKDEATGDPIPSNLAFTKNHQPPYGQGWEKRVNGQLNPTITLRPGQTEIWTLGSIGRNGFYNLGIVDSQGQSPWSGTVLARDGNSQDLVPRAVSLALPQPYLVEGPTFVAPGARLTLAVTAPTTPGTYYLVDNLSPSIQPLAEFFALATIEVAGTPIGEPPPVFPPVGEIPAVFHQAPDRERTFTFSIDGDAFLIDGHAFPDGPIVTLQAGQIEQWTLVNASGVDHPFHIHQTDFAAISINGQPVQTTGEGVYPFVSLRDTVTIPANGQVVIRWQVTPHLGKYVFHCHILTHEDAGMMMGVLAIPNEQQRRIAIGARAGEGGKVIVLNGSGRRLGRIRALPANWQGGVATAVGDLTGDLIEDIIAGPAAPGRRNYIKVYDGATLSQAHRFMAFPESPRAGVSLAVGDVDGDGRGEIIAGRVGAGPGLVRIFRPDGSVRLELDGGLPGDLPNGVTVASADYNGDNYDDIAVGAGRDAEPRVLGLDGFSLAATAERTLVKLFDFVIPGGPKSGVQVAGGYFDPATRPGLLGNLITTPLLGRLAGTISVWNVEPSLSTIHGASTAHGNVPADGSFDTADHDPAQPRLPPVLLTSYQPFAERVPGGVRLQVTHLGADGTGTIVAWRGLHRRAYLTATH